MNCYLCHGSRFRRRPGKVRDASRLKVLECVSCGLVFLSSFAHIKEGFYENSGMHDTGWDLARWRRESSPDDQRRFEYLKARIRGKRVLDFGIGNAGFLLSAAKVAKETAGIEPEQRHQRVFRREGLTIYRDESVAPGRFDFVTAFHVLEHLTDPRGMLKILSRKLGQGGRLIIEVPSADDALLKLYGCRAFSEFTYWSCHLFLFTPTTLRKLGEQAGLKVDSVEQVQRFPLSNHLHWLAKGKPGGHREWAFLDEGGASERYARRLAAIGGCDTLMGEFSNVSKGRPA